MKYFVLSNQRQGSCYYEFYKGRWDKKTFWKEDSICLDDDLMYIYEINSLIMKVNPKYDPFRETELSKKQWYDLVDAANQAGGITAEIIAEADVWARQVFLEYDRITILGI